MRPREHEGCSGTAGVQLAHVLDRCLALEERTAALYRRFAGARADDRELAELWTDLAADEEEHACSIRSARSSLLSGTGELTTVQGCEDAFEDVAARLRSAEALEEDATPDRQLAAALDIELSEIEVLRQLALRASGRYHAPDQDRSHVHRLTDAARRRSQDDRVRLAVALLLARERLAAAATATKWGDHT
jgi:hypothetical protein